eukprot:TRINITY_DN4380_c0_g1_i1.p1 TRINITY_DN4380_c0_g1~~TRINITY_DN4380_c0_g1_i1.p1  ORF type:complete len:64 (+),score=5.87 TRINITY_DN4380_c0_g1_i1:239-430(+)
MHLVGEVHGSDCIVIEDIIDTAKTISRITEDLKNMVPDECLYLQCTVCFREEKNQKNYFPHLK